MWTSIAVTNNSFAPIAALSMAGLPKPIALPTWVATIDPTSSLTPGTAYYVQIEKGAIEDLAGNDFAGITDTSK